MSSIVIKTDIAPALVAWIKTIHPTLPVIWTRPNAPRPPQTYIGLEITTPLQKPGFSDSIEYIIDEDDDTSTIFNIGGHRNFTVSVNAYLVKNSSNRNVHDDMFDAHDILEKIRDATENPAAMESLNNAGLSVMDTADILDLTELLETGFESRYQMDLMMGIASNREEDLGAIESVKFQGTVDGVEEDEITVNE